MLRTARIVGPVLAGLLWMGCLGPGTTRVTRLFVLDPTASIAGSSEADAVAEASIGVGPVALPKRLERPQILTRTSDHEVQLAEFAQWAEPLDRSFARAVAENLARTIPTERVSVYPWNRSAQVDWQIEIDVSRFEQEANGTVTLLARWRVIGNQPPETLRHGTSNIRQDPEGPGVDALVAAMSRAVGTLSEEIAAALPRAAPVR